MSNTLLMTAEEVAQELGVSKDYAYRLIRCLNKELDGRGFIIVTGRVSRQYFYEKVYGAAQLAERSANGSIQG